MSFAFVKYKQLLRNVVRSKRVLEVLKDKAVASHKLYKCTTLFLRAFCLARGLAPEVDLSVIKLCMNNISIRDARGKQPKDSCGLRKEMESFGKTSFSKVYPEPLDFSGSSYLKQLIPESILTSV